VQLVESDSVDFSRWGISGTRAGSIEFKPFAEGEIEPGVNFFFALMRFGANGEPFETPRHNHNFHQIRYVVDGVHNYAPRQDLPKGWVGYFPAGAHYGPQRDGGGTVLYLQYGEGYISDAQQKHAFAEMSKVGTFENGVYTTIDASGKKRNQDSIKALFEFVQGRELVFPTPQYPEPITINPDAFTWVSLGEGLRSKPLATFSDRQVAMTVLRWDAPCTRAFSEDESHFVFTLTDGLRVDGGTHPARTAIWSPGGEPLALDGDAGAEALGVSVPATPITQH
jgi:hypothetical protein